MSCESKAELRDGRMTGAEIGRLNGAFGAGCWCECGWRVWRRVDKSFPIRRGSTDHSSLHETCDF